MKKSKTCIKLSILIFALIGVSFSTSLALAEYKKNANQSSFSFKLAPAANTNRITFYTTYNGNWGGSSYEDVEEGNTLSSVPTVSLSGYTFQGWTTAVPSTTNYTAQISSSALSTKNDFSSNVTYYPILKSNSEKGFDGTNYHTLNTDVTISSKTISSYRIGYSYLGVAGIPSASATANNLNLLSNSGIYQFSKSGSSVSVKRKVGLRIAESGYWSSNSNEYYSLYCFDSSTSQSESWNLKKRTNATSSSYVGYWYVDYSFQKFIFVRQSSETTGWNAKWNQSGDILLLNNNDYNQGSSYTSYSSSNYVLDKNTSWADTWLGKWTNLTS